MGKPIDSMFIEVKTEFNDEGFKEAVSGLEAVKKRSMQGGAALKDMASMAGKAILAAGTAITAGSVVIGKKFDDIKKKADVLGTSVRDLEMLGYAIEDAGGDGEEAFSWLYGLNQAIASDKMSGELKKSLLKESQGAFDISVLQIKDVQDRAVAILGEFNTLSADAKKRVAPVLGLSQSIQTLSQSGIEGIRKTIAELEKVKGSDVDGDILADQGEQLNRALLEVKVAFSGMGEVLAINLLPTINDVISKTAKWGTESARTLTAFFSGTISGFEMVKKFAKDAFEIFEVDENFADVTDTFINKANEWFDDLTQLVTGDEPKKPTLENMKQDDFMQRALASQAEELGIKRTPQPATQEAEQPNITATRPAIDNPSAQFAAGDTNSTTISTTNNQTNNASAMRAQTQINNNVTVNVSAGRTSAETSKAVGDEVKRQMQEIATTQSQLAVNEFSGGSQ